MTSIKDALKEVRAVYKSVISDDYIIVMKNNDTYEMDSRASEPNGLNTFAGNITEYQGMPEGVRINKHSLPDKVKAAIKDRVEMEGVSHLGEKDFNDLGYEMSYKGVFAFKNAGKGDVSSKWKKGTVVSIDEIDEYAADTIEYPEWEETVGKKLKVASQHEEEYNTILWQWIYGYSYGIREQLEERGCIIEEN